MKRTMQAGVLVALLTWLISAAPSSGQTIFGGSSTNPYTGKTTYNVSNPYTGAHAAGASSKNPYTGRTTRAGGYVNPYTGRSGAGASSYNPYTGRYASASRGRVR